MLHHSYHKGMIQWKAPAVLGKKAKGLKWLVVRKNSRPQGAESFSPGIINTLYFCREAMLSFEMFSSPRYCVQN